MPVVRLPLIGNTTERDESTVLASGMGYDQQFRNVFFRNYANPYTGKTSVEVRQASGFTSFITPPGSDIAGRAVKQWVAKTNTIVSAFGATNDTIYENTSSLGAITGHVKFFSETSISGTANIVAVADSNRAWFYPSGGALTEITDTDFPTQTPALTLTGNFVHKDGYAFIMCTNGTIWHSDLNSLSAWTSTSNITAQDVSDPGKGLMSYKGYIAAFGSSSIEFFQNAGNPAGSVLSRVTGSTINIGVPNERCMCKFMSTIAFIGVSDQSGVGVYVLEGFQAKKISSPLVDAYLATTGAAATVTLNVYMESGQIHLALMNSTGSSSGFIYHPHVELWTVYYSGVIAFTQSDIYVSSTTSRMIFVASSGASGYVLASDSTGYLAATLLLGPIDFGTDKRKTLNKFSIIGNGFGQSASDSGFTAVVSFADLDDQTYGSTRNLYLKTRQNSFHRGGSFERRIIKIVLSGATSTDRFINSIELDYSVGST